MRRAGPGGQIIGQTKDIPRLTRALAETSAASGPKTLTRDLNERVSVRLLRVIDGRYQANTDVLMTLLPLTVLAEANGPAR